MAKHFVMSLLLGAAAAAVQFAIDALSGADVPPEIAPWGPLAVALLRAVLGYLEVRRGRASVEDLGAKSREGTGS